MASLTSFLTRAEWNAALFVAMYAEWNKLIAPQPDLSTRLRMGIVLLYKSGMRFDGVAVLGDAMGPDDVAKVTLIDDPANVSALVEHLKGDRAAIMRRLEEFLEWADQRPHLDVAGATAASIRKQLAEMEAR